MKLEMDPYPVENLNSNHESYEETPITNQYEEKLEILHEYASKLNSSTTLEEVGNITIKTIKNVLNNKNITRIWYFQGTSNNYKFFNNRIEKLEASINSSKTAYLASQTGKTQYIPDLTREFDIITNSEQEQGALSEVAIPVKINEKVVAILNVHSKDLGDFTFQSQRLLEILALHTASALQRIQYTTKLTKLREELNKETIEGIQRIAERFSHDLRGPLQAISNSSYLLRQSVKDKEKLLNMIDKSINKCRYLINEMQNQTQALNIKPILTDINLLLDKALELTVIPENIKVIKNYQNQFIAYMLDKNKLRQVFLNLIKNAIEAMPNGGTINISTIKDNENISIIISDTGVGISEKNRNNLFQPFYTTKETGLGLGLAYSKNVIEAHKGKITIEPNEKIGTRVNIILPIRK